MAVTITSNNSENVYGVGDLISAGKGCTCKFFIFQIDKNKFSLTEVCGNRIGCGIYDSSPEGACQHSSYVVVHRSQSSYRW